MNSKHDENPFCDDVQAYTIITQKRVAFESELTVSKFNCKIRIFGPISKKSVRISIFR